MSENKSFWDYCQAEETLWKIEQAFFLIEAGLDVYHFADQDTYKKQNLDKIIYFVQLYQHEVKILLPKLRQHLENSRKQKIS